MQAISTVNFLNEVELYATKVIAEEFSDKLVYHSIEHTHCVVSGVKRIATGEGLSLTQTEPILIAAWFSTIGFKNLDNWDKYKKLEDILALCQDDSIKETKKFLTSISYPPEKLAKVVSIIQDASHSTTPISKGGKILSDAITIELTSKKAKKKINLRYQELLLLGLFKKGKINYFDAVLTYLKDHTYYTAYGQKELEPRKIELINKIEKEQKNLAKNEDRLLSKELDITEQEVKKLKKSLKNISGRDDRGVQTMFRTTSRNHYTLSQMVDRKANILISVNAILLSLIIGRFIGEFDHICIHTVPATLLLISSLASVIFAVLSILPSRTHGEFSEEEIRAKKGNLLYYGNYHNMTLKDYNWGMLQMLNDSNYLYTSMIRDLYYLGQRLHEKHRKIRMALVVFVGGIILTVISFLIVSSMPDFHLGGPHIG